ncbi:MAG: hypothetical protein KDK54_02705 [Leptospiraceae bacterium]|nr:hypothetical protein [Leptospiraceae bacterium]
MRTIKLPDQLNIFLAIFLFVLNCSSLPIMDSRDWKDNSFPISFEKNTYTVTRFKTKSPSKKNIVLLDPVFLSKEMLYPSSFTTTFTPGDKSGLTPYLITHEVANTKDHATLIPSFLEEGFNVYLIQFPETANLKSTAGDLNRILDEIVKQDSSDSFIIGGLSLGGQTLAHYLQLDIHPKIKKIFFLGTGFDYNHTGSLLEKMKTTPSKGGEYKCNLRERENLCNQYITSIYLDKAHRNALSYPVKIPELEKDPITSFSKLSSSPLPILIVFGKLDGISPEESVLIPFFPHRKGNSKLISILEASTANYMDLDYDHFDLFYHKKSKSEIYSKMIDWMEED